MILLWVQLLWSNQALKQHFVEPKGGLLDKQNTFE
jgi:hypothetical protein